MSLIAAQLEQHGIATVIMGCARDIVEHAGVPRLLFSDFPLGNSAGRPHDPASQAATLALALDLLEQAQQARTTWVSPQAWAEGQATAKADDWKADFLNISQLSPATIARLRAEFAEQQRVTNQRKTVD